MQSLIRTHSTKFFLYFPIALLSLTLALGPSFHILPVLSTYNDKRLMQVSLLIVLALTLLFNPSVRTKVTKTAQSAPVLVWRLFALAFALGVISSAASPSPRHAFLELGLLGLLGFMAVYLATLFRQAPQKTNEGVLVVLFFSATISFGLFLANWFQVLAGQLETVFDSLFHGFVNARFLNQWQGMILPLVLAAGLLRTDSTVKHHIFLVLLIAYLWAGIFFSGGRGVFLASILGILISGWLFKESRDLWFRWHLAAFIGGLVFYILVSLSIFIATGSTLTDGLGLSRITENTSSSGRLDLWQSALQTFIQHPILGIGPMHIAWDTHHTTLLTHPHNIIIQLLAEWGGPAAILFITIAVTLFLKWIKLSREYAAHSLQHSLLVTALTSALLTGNIHALVSGVWVMPLSQLTMILIIGWMVGLHLSQHSPQPLKTRSLAATVLLSGFFLVSLIYGLYPEVTNFNEWLIQSYEATGRDVFHPRFWLQGYIMEATN